MEENSYWPLKVMEKTDLIVFSYSIHVFWKSMIMIPYFKNECTILT